MALETKTIKEIIEKVDEKSILLPAMQRKFVWDADRIIALFDSIMKDFPFGSLIFWNISNKAEIKKYQFYEFVKEYKGKNETLNPSAGPVAKEKIDVVMDGQQRLTSLYVGIKGSVKAIDKWKRKNNSQNWKTKYLYIRPFKPIEERDDDEESFSFAFLEEDWVERWNETHEDWNKYYKVSEFYNMNKKTLREFLNVGQIPTNKNDWKNILDRLRKKLNEEELLSYHVIQNTSISDVLEIFKRINNGGTPLSPANLLFSTVITSWEAGRKMMDDFISGINKDKIILLKEDFLVRACVYLMDMPSAVKIETLTNEVVNKIKDNWGKITKAIGDVAGFLKERNIAHDVIKSYNALLPIIYYFYKDTNVSKEEKDELFKFFVVSQLFGLFGGNSASTLDAVRKQMCRNQELGKDLVSFKIKYLYDIDLSAGRLHAFKISKEQIEKLIDGVKYKDRQAYTLLCLLHPNIKVTNKGDYFDIDHVCSQAELKALFKEFTKEEKKEWENMMNGIPNLQLLDYRQNRGDKNKDTLYEWVVVKKQQVDYDPFANESDKQKYQLKSVDIFKEFYNGRRDKIIEKLCNLLDVT